MKIKNLLSLILSFITTIKASTILTPSGTEIPTSLLTYLDCPIGDENCKNSKRSTCVAHSSLCQHDNEEFLRELLSENGYTVENFKPIEFCEVLLEVCDMIMKYDPPLTGDYIYDYERYFTCDVADFRCINNNIMGCYAVVKKCWKNYSIQDCKRLSVVCDGINTGVIPTFTPSKSQRQPKQNQSRKEGKQKPKVKVKKKVKTKAKTKVKTREKTKEKPLTPEKIIFQRQYERSRPLRKLQQRNRQQIKEELQRNIIPIEEFLEKLIPERLLEKLPLKYLHLEKLNIRKRIRQIRQGKRFFRLLKNF